MRGIIYSINILGMGHLINMMHLCRGFLEFGKIDFIHGGRPIFVQIKSPNFHSIKLLYDPVVSINIFDLADYYKKHKDQFISMFAKRRETLFEHIKGHYDFVIIEQVPFSKQLYNNEVTWIIQKVKAENPHALIIGSQRGIVKSLSRKLSRERFNEFQRIILQTEIQAVKFINRFYDKVLIHSDPNIIKLDETFESVLSIQQKLIYTGFITDPTFVKKKIKIKKRVIIFLNSLCDVIHFFHFILQTAPRFPDYDFLFIKTTSESFDRFEKKVNELAYPNVRITPVLNNFVEELSISSLAITGSGTTILSLYQSGVPAIVYPTGELSDQWVYAEKFAEKGLVTIITSKDITPDRLFYIIKNTLKEPRPKSQYPINIDGVKNSVRIINKLVSDKAKTR